MGSAPLTPQLLAREKRKDEPEEELEEKEEEEKDKAPVQTGVYIGEKDGDTRHGKGKFQFANGDWYDGEWVQNKAQGQGTFSTKQSVYKGGWNDDLKQGYGEEKYAEMNCFYVGNFRQGYRHGQGKITFPDANEYEGEFVSGNQEGFGTFRWKSKSKEGQCPQYTGEWSENNMHGQGRYEWPDGNSYDGHYNTNFKEGQGTFISKNGQRMTCIWKDGKPNGPVVFKGPKYEAPPSIWLEGVMISWANRSEPPTPRKD